MRQTLILAAMYMAYPLGVRENAWKLESRLSTNIDGMLGAISPYVMPAVEMVEVAETMAMARPDKVEQHVYEGFGSWFAGHVREYKKFPEEEQAINMLRSLVQTVFASVLTQTQREVLANKLAEMF